LFLPAILSEMKRVVEQPSDSRLRTCVTCGKTGLVKVDFYEAKPGSQNDRTYGGVAMPCKVCNRARCRGKERSPEQKLRDSARQRTPEYQAQKKLWDSKESAREKNRARCRKRYYAKHSEVRAEQRERYRTDPEYRARVADDTRARRATPEGRAAHNASNARLKKTDRGRLLSRMHAQLRRARMRDIVCDLTDVQWVALVEAYGGCCAYCGAIPEETITPDHVIPLCDGGAHSLSNVVPACRDCNLKKNRKPIHAFLNLMGYSRVTFDAWRSSALSIVLREAA
jgi:5-methylcytosine-specific restriction endonuclease McrA